MEMNESSNMMFRDVNGLFGIYMSLNKRMLLLDPFQLHQMLVLMPKQKTFQLHEVDGNDKYTIDVVREDFIVTLNLVTQSVEDHHTCHLRLDEFVRTCIRCMSRLRDVCKTDGPLAYPHRHVFDEIWKVQPLVIGINRKNPFDLTKVVYGNVVFDLKWESDGDIVCLASLGETQIVFTAAEYTSFSYLRNQLELMYYSYGSMDDDNGKCELRFVEDYWGESAYIYFERGWVYVAHSEIRDGVDVAACCCNIRSAIRNIYENLLYFGMQLWHQRYYEMWDDGRILYNELKSRTVERYLQGINNNNRDRYLDSRVPVKHFLTFSYGDSYLTDEKGRKYKIVNDTIVLDRLVKKSCVIVVDGLSQCLDAKPQGESGQWHNVCETFLSKIREALPPSVDLWVVDSDGAPRQIMINQQEV